MQVFSFRSFVFSDEGGCRGQISEPVTSVYVGSYLLDWIRLAYETRTNENVLHTLHC